MTSTDNLAIMGLDPGHSGGIALLVPPPDKNTLVWSFNKTATLRDLWVVIGGCASFNVHAYMEDVHSFPSQGVKSMFTFGRHYGNLEAFLTAHQISFDRVQPPVWQRGFGLTKRKGETKVRKKNRHKALAQELFPELSCITHATADALLIAEYGRRIHHD